MNVFYKIIDIYYFYNFLQLKVVVVWNLIHFKLNFCFLKIMRLLTFKGIVLCLSPCPISPLLQIISSFYNNLPLQIVSCFSNKYPLYKL